MLLYESYVKTIKNVKLNLKLYYKPWWSRQKIFQRKFHHQLVSSTLKHDLSYWVTPTADTKLKKEVKPRRRANKIKIDSIKWSLNIFFLKDLTIYEKIEIKPELAKQDNNWIQFLIHLIKIISTMCMK